jgi:Sec-independent protein translocase protein TatA
LGKINEKTLYIIIIVLLIISGIAIFRSCGNDNNSEIGFNRIIEYTKWFGAGIRSARKYISDAINDKNRIEQLNNELSNTIIELERTIKDNTREFERKLAEFDSGIESGTIVIERAREKTNRIRTIIEGLLEPAKGQDN